MADEPLAHPSLEDVADSAVRDYVKLMGLDRRLVEGELHTTPGGRWTALPLACRPRARAARYLSRRLDDRVG